MKITRICYLPLVVLLVFMLGIPGNPALAEPLPGTADVLVNFYQPPGADEISLIESLGGTVNKVYHVVPAVAAVMPAENLDELRADPRVESVEDDITFSAALAGEVLPWGVDRVDAELVHPVYKGTGVKVAVLDTGIDFDHPDLAVSGNVTFVAGTSDGDDDNGHGTLVAGIVAALDNEIGVIGVAPEASLYSVKVLDQNGDGTMSNILSGIEWALDNNMQVVNMSFGGLAEMPSTIVQALDSAYAAGIVIVAGSGGSGNPGGTGNNVWAPARYESVIAVGATDNQDARYSSSSTGYTLELAAPGVNIYSTAMGGGYANLSGTSASSPHAAGVAALLIDSGISSNTAVRDRMRNSAEDLGAAGWDSLFGKGMVNADLAISFSEPPDQTQPVTAISVNGTQSQFGWYNTDVTVTLTAQDDAGGSGVSEIKYSLDGGQGWQTYSSPFIVSSEGTNLVLARAWDNAGNDEGPPAFVQIKIDKTMPNPSTISVRSGTMGNNGWYVSDVEVDMWTTDNPGGSGVAGMEYSLDNGQSWYTYTPFLVITADGNKTLLVRGRDKAGNVEAPPASAVIKIDQTPPDLTETSVPGLISKDKRGTMVNVSYNGTAADPVSGLNTTNTQLIDEYGELSQYLGSALSGTVAVEAWVQGSDGNGRTYTFRLTATDLAGNQTSVDAVTTVLHH
ncbi:MAG: S8 family serine peptidase [Dehalococcoidales bacterium]|nr:S8 family serine peptidase [Dehalococcoidales bacterium]